MVWNTGQHANMMKKKDKEYLWTIKQLRWDWLHLHRIEMNMNEIHIGWNSIVNFFHFQRDFL